MRHDNEEIRSLIECWARAVHAGDMPGVLAGHAEDIVMFDVPPPYEGVRGRHAYREQWPPFFEWQAQGASFEIESLHITAGDDVAFAFALLRCGTPQDFAENPRLRLRLTLGLRKERDEWVVVHEHHSFPYLGAEATRSSEAAEEVRRVHQLWFEGTAIKDLDGLMSNIADDIVSYEHDAPLQHTGVDSVREVCKQGLETSSGQVGWDVPDLTVIARGDIAVAWGLNRMTAEAPDGQLAESWSRGTRVFQQRNGQWMLIHQHHSYPYNPTTGEVETDLRP